MSLSKQPISKDNMRSEEKIFSELSTLCVKPGFAHVIAYLSWRDNAFKFIDDLEVKDVIAQSSSECLCRTEISTLIGLMLRQEIDLTLRRPQEMQSMIDKAEALLSEMHQTMYMDAFSTIDFSRSKEDGYNPFSDASMLREPIFYGGDSAYTSQYLDLSEKKYSKDDSWLQEHKGFLATDVCDVIRCIMDIRSEKATAMRESFTIEALDEWTLLPALTFTAEEISDRLQKNIEIVENVITSFTVPTDSRNKDFLSLGDFNIANAYPIIGLDNDKYILLQQYNLAEAYYETPFFWFMADIDYRPNATENRGVFTEEFSEERLKLVFGENNVFSNIDIVKNKGKKAGEIDVLIVFADRAIVLQAKSKKLRLSSRKGNDQTLKEDFKKAIQSSYDQGFSCASLLEDSSYRLQDANSNEIDITRQFKEIYIFCVVSDHYPALSFQARQFLSYKQTDKILPPFVMDVFLLDVMTEMLQSPLQFLSYINRRVLYSDKLLSMQELTVLSYHLKNNLRVDEKYTQVALTEDISADLDLAMMVRREGLPGKATPDGILTRYKNTTVGNLIAQIETMEDPGTVDLGFMLLLLSEDSLRNISQGIDKLAKLARKDDKPHDLTLMSDIGDTGLTIHCTDRARADAEASLGLHCTQRKYTQRAANWFGICLDPNTKQLRFGMAFHYEWKESTQLNELVKNLPTRTGKLKKKMGGQGFGKTVSSRKKNKERS